jgi:hypothetical protein
MLLCGDFYGLSGASNRQFANPYTDPYLDFYPHTDSHCNPDPVSNSPDTFGHADPNLNRDVDSKRYDNLHRDRHLDHDIHCYDHTYTHRLKYTGDTQHHSFANSGDTQPNTCNAQPNFRSHHHRPEYQYADPYRNAKPA